MLKKLKPPDSGWSLWLAALIIVAVVAFAAGYEVRELWG
jgi:hypothetical protein